MIITLKKIPFKDNAAGLTVGPIIFLTKEYADNKSYIEHEKLHVRMFWYWVAPTALLALAGWFLGFLGLWTAVPLAFAGAGVRAALYNFSEKYRLWEEVKGYAIQAEIDDHSDEKMRKTAELIYNNYNVKNSNVAEIYEDLVNERESNT